jgi:hypothetical protein
MSSSTKLQWPTPFCSTFARQKLRNSLAKELLSLGFLPTTVFQLGYSTNHQHRIIISIVAIFICIKTTAQPRVPKPSFDNFLTLSTQNSQLKQQTSNNIFNDPNAGTNMPLGMTAADVQNQVNLQAMQQMGVGQTNTNYRQNQIQQLQEFKNGEAKGRYSNSLANFQSYLSQLLQLNPDNFSITKAVYLSEAVFYDKPFTYDQFLKAIQQRASFVKQILKQEGMSIKKGFAVHYAIQKLFSQNCVINQANNKQVVIRKIEYDFEDFFGDNDYSKMFVTKLLQTNSGQCRSMPLLYLCIAEQLKTKAWLSLALQHSFIKFIDKKGNLSNFEATNGHTVSTTWLLQSNAISSIALKNKTYLDTLSSRKLFSQCLADFQMVYLVKNGYDDFTDNINKQILAIDSSNMNALMYNSNIATFKYKQLQKQNKNAVAVSQALAEMQQAQQKVNDLGYQDMPKEQYIQWLKSIEVEKAKRKLKN